MGTAKIGYDIDNTTALLRRANRGSEDEVNLLINHLSKKLKINAKIMESLDPACIRSDIIQLTYFKSIDFEHVSWEDRAYFFAISSHCLRHILMIHLQNNSVSGKPESKDQYLDKLLQSDCQHNIININAVLNNLSTLNSQLVEVVECRYFGNMAFEDIATALDISRAEAKRDWAKARGWIYKEINKTAIVY